ncbi:TRAP transporter substrate-binding protein [Bacillus sp. B15-48]|uniref:TRAP transporter substrate-binding protein n=1 Tax=Bacillus sp. B15-48 TaxID=1548601 RepID=UPI00193F6F28|nr:TRAP transporter substrate-binding protein [Bacillus sp. B15-48]MBM4761256.1 DctP family TRAP transporter solute-binding subunit [Bacillus sp. B15-48]
MKKKFSILSALLAIVLLLAACGGGSSDEASGDGSDGAANAGKTIKWKLGHLADENHIWHKTSQEFANLVNEKTDGQIEITVFPSNTLGGETDTINAIAAGTADLVISGETLQNWAPKAALMATPYAFRDADHVRAVVEGEIGDEIAAEIHEKAGLTPLFYMQRAPRNLTSTEAIQTPADLNGFSMRVPNVPLFLNAWQAAGAKPQVMDFNEVFTGIQSGVIKGQENPVDLIKSGALYEVQGYVNQTEHVHSWIYILVGNKQFDALTDEQRAAVQEAAAEAQAFAAGLLDSEIVQITEDLKAEGMEFVEVDQDAFREAMKPAIESSLSEDQLDLYERILAVE